MSAPASHSSRGASVLAALVVAAVLASIAMLVQQGSPVAYTQSQTADVAAPHEITAGGQKEKCDYRLDYTFTYEDGKLVESQSKYCASNAASCENKNGELVPKDQNRHSQIKACAGMASTGKDTCTYTSCDPSKDEAVNDIGRAGVVSSGLQDLQDGNPVMRTEDLKALSSDLNLDNQQQSLLDTAYKTDQIDKNIADNTDTFDKAQTALDNMAQADPSAFKQCQTMSYSAGCEQQALLTQTRDQAQKNIHDLYAQRDALAAQQQALDGSGGQPGAATPGPDTSCDATCQLKKENDLLKQALQQRQTGFGGGTGGGSGGQGTGGNPLSNLLKGLMGGGSGSGGSGSGSNQQQQCQPQYQCAESAVQYNQCPQQNAPWQTVRQCPTGYSCQNNGCVATAPYGTCTSGQPRTAPPQAQPPASSCTVGTWTDTSNGCQQSWQCVASTQTPTGSAPTAQLSCQPLKAVPNMTVTLSYACAGGATVASATGFSIPSSTTLSGSATTSIAKPTTGTSITYALTCTNGSATPNTTASAQCVIEVGSPSIVMVATPEKIAKSETDDIKRKSTIGWVTTGMQSCVVSNADFSDWTSQQAGNTSISGAATSPVITQDTTFLLTCQTIAGSTATSSVRVLSI